MLRKCQVCDSKGEKTIDTNESKYVKQDGKYYHYQCFIRMLIKRKKMTEEDAILEAERVIELNTKDIEDDKAKDRFFKTIYEMYNVPVPSWVFVKINRVVKGGYKKGNPQVITYQELYDMYSNEKMVNKLEKIAYSKGIKEPEDRMNWDLGVMFNEYPNYVKAKRRSMKQKEEAQEALKNIQKYHIDPNNRYKEDREKTKRLNKESTNIDSIVDDLLG